ncbi:MAG TPA: alanyl-tRNA editing protein [Parachlamydiaceae bacterium]|nr:alanyl-tRNA editing protein [Parachlamydiaceae bacterium]
MKKVFWIDPYLTKLDTKVASIDGNEIVFEETIAYSESGGQESDKATINGIEVLSSRMDKSEPYLIYYTLPEGHGLSVGNKVSMEIDWPRRNRLMRFHFTCELILVLMNRLFNKTPEGIELRPEEIDTVIKKRGAHMSEDAARIDFECAVNIAEYFPVILSEYQKIIDADLPIEKGYLNEANEIRYWRLPNIAMIPCGGTHVNSTGEIGDINLKRDRANKGVERIRISLKERFE